MDIPKTLATFGTRHKTKQNTHNTENVKGKQLTPAMLLILYIYICLTRKGNTTIIEAPFFGSGCGRVVQGAGRKAKRLVLKCINGVGSNLVEGRTKI